MLQYLVYLSSGRIREVKIKVSSTRDDRLREASKYSDLI